MIAPALLCALFVESCAGIREHAEGVSHANSILSPAGGGNCVQLAIRRARIVPRRANLHSPQGAGKIGSGPGLHRAGGLRPPGDAGNCYENVHRPIQGNQRRREEHPSHERPCPDSGGSGLRKRQNLHLQSGNAVFRADQKRAGRITGEVSARILKNHRFEPKVLLLELSELRGAVVKNPFPAADGKALHFFFMESRPQSPIWKNWRPSGRRRNDSNSGKRCSTSTRPMESAVPDWRRKWSRAWGSR